MTTTKPPVLTDEDIESALNGTPAAVAGVSPTGEQLYALVTSRFEGGSFPWAMVKESGKKAWADAAAELLLKPDSILAKYGRQAQPSGNAGEVDPSAWQGWATQKPDRLPKLWGARHIAELNWDEDGEADLIRLVQVERIAASKGANHG